MAGLFFFLHFFFFSLFQLYFFRFFARFPLHIQFCFLFFGFSFLFSTLFQCCFDFCSIFVPPGLFPVFFFRFFFFCGAVLYFVYVRLVHVYFWTSCSNLKIWAHGGRYSASTIKKAHPTRGACIVCRCASVASTADHSAISHAQRNNAHTSVLYVRADQSATTQESRQNRRKPSSRVLLNERRSKSAVPIYIPTTYKQQQLVMRQRFAYIFRSSKMHHHSSFCPFSFVHMIMELYLLYSHVFLLFPLWSSVADGSHPRSKAPCTVIIALTLPPLP